MKKERAQDKCIPNQKYTLTIDKRNDSETADERHREKKWKEVKSKPTLQLHYKHYYLSFV